MPASAPRDSTLAVVGDGFGSLIVYSTAIYLGFKPEEITIYGPSDNPVGTYQQFAYNLGQTVLRSESESHFLPGRLADVRRARRLVAPQPRAARALHEAQVQPRRPGDPDRGRRRAAAPELGRLARAGARRLAAARARIRRTSSSTTRTRNFIGRSKHVMLALGHGPLSFPATLAKAKAADPEIDDRIVQAYQAKSYHPDGRYIVLGAGIASINEWANALDVGAKCIALRRNPAPDEQDLNVPRCLFESLGIDAFAGLPFEQRVQFLGNVLKGTTPRRRSWLERIEQRPQRGALRGAAGRDRHRRARARRAARARLQPLRRGPRLARRHRASSPAPASTSPSSRCRCCAG